MFFTAHDTHDKSKTLKEVLYKHWAYMGLSMYAAFFYLLFGYIENNICFGCIKYICYVM